MPDRFRHSKMAIKRSDIAILLIDVINDLDFPGSEGLTRAALPMARKIAALKQRARQAAVPSIYVNDNFGQWRSNFKDVIAYCSREGSRGKPIVELLHPEPDDYFVLKPLHSAFFGTSLDIILHELGVNQLILTGIATNICVLFTANDAYMRGFDICIPRDCVAANKKEDTRYALSLMQNILKAKITSSDRLALKEVMPERKSS